MTFAMPSDAPAVNGSGDEDGTLSPEAAGNLTGYPDTARSNGGGEAGRTGAVALAAGGQRSSILARLGITSGGHFCHDRKFVWSVLRRHGIFRWYFAGSLISNFGTWLQTTAQILLVYRMTHSVFGIGVLTSAQFLFPLLLGSWAGAIASRFGSKPTLVLSQLMSALLAVVLAALEWSGGLTETRLIAGALGAGLCTTFSLPAQSAIAGALVLPSAGDGKHDDTDTVAAMAMNSVSYNAGRALAPVFSILTVTMIGFGWAFALNAVSFGLFAVMLRRVHCPASAGQTAARSPVMQGVRIALGQPKILVLLLMVAFITLADDPVLVLGPALARHVFHASDDWSGYFSCALGCGSVLGSLLPRQSASARRAATALAILGASMIGFVYMPWIVMSLVMAFATGVACLVASSTLQALLYKLGGKNIAAQVMGFWTVAWAGSKPIASFVDGALPGHLGIQMTGVFMAFPAFLPILILIFGPTSLVGWFIKFRLLRKPQEQPV